MKCPYCNDDIESYKTLGEKLTFMAHIKFVHPFMYYFDRRTWWLPINEEFEQIKGGWKWTCPICSKVVLSDSIAYLEGFRASHTAIAHRVDKECLEVNR